MTEGKCAIWGTPAKLGSEGQQLIYNSPRAGGRYKTIGSMAHLFDWSNEKKAKLTTWLVDQREAGIDAPFIPPSSDFEVEIISRHFLSTSQRLHRFFLYCHKFKNRIGDTFIFENQHRYKESFDPRYDVHNDSNDPSNMAIMAYIECIRDYDLDLFSDYLSSSNFIRRYSVEEVDSYILAPMGIEKLDSISTNANSKQAFVAMWFDGKMDEIYENGIQPAIEGESFKPIRIDKEHHTKNIIDFMIGEIKRSKFVVADFTSMVLKDSENRDRQVDIGGVYFEAGYALGLNIPVIWTCHKNHSGSIHFDLKQFNTIFYTDADDLKLQLSTRIRRMFVT